MGRRRPTPRWGLRSFAGGSGEVTEEAGLGLGPGSARPGEDRINEDFFGMRIHIQLSDYGNMLHSGSTGERGNILWIDGGVTFYALAEANILW